MGIVKLSFKKKSHMFLLTIEPKAFFNSRRVPLLLPPPSSFCHSQHLRRSPQTEKFLQSPSHLHQLQLLSRFKWQHYLLGASHGIIFNPPLNFSGRPYQNGWRWRWRLLTKGQPQLQSRIVLLARSDKLTGGIGSFFGVILTFHLNHHPLAQPNETRSLVLC